MKYEEESSGCIVKNSIMWITDIYLVGPDFYLNPTQLGMFELVKRILNIFSQVKISVKMFLLFDISERNLQIREFIKNLT